MIRFAFVAAAVLAALPARAASCTVVSTSDLVFGAYDVFSPTPTVTAGGLTLHCSDVDADDAVTIALSAGGGADYARRRLANGAHELAYQLFVDAAATVVWGDGTSGTAVVGPFAPAADTTLPIYGRLPARQDVPAGAYSDTLVVTILF